MRLHSAKLVTVASDRKPLLMIELLLTMRNASCRPAPGDTRMLIVAPGVFLVRGSQLDTVWTVTEGNSVEWAPAPHLAHGAVFSGEHQVFVLRFF